METRGSFGGAGGSGRRPDRGRRSPGRAFVNVAVAWLAVLALLVPAPVAGSGPDPGADRQAGPAADDRDNGMAEETGSLEETDWSGGEEWLSEEHASIADPLEPMNRFFFAVNDRLYFWVLKPVSRAYGRILPEDVRIGVGNCFDNLQAPLRLINALLQGKVKGATIVLARFVINSTLGVAGFGDPAKTEFNLATQAEDFGQTLGHYGVGEGVYLCWPLLGPSSIRDSCGTALDSFFNLTSHVVPDKPAVAVGLYTGQRINQTSLSLEDYELFRKYSFDPYVAMREAYVQYRRNQTLDKAAKGGSFLSEGAEPGYIPSRTLN